VEALESFLTKGKDEEDYKSSQKEYRRSKGQAKEVCDLRGLGTAAEETRREIRFKVTVLICRHSNALRAAGGWIAP
jgi:hypothetical protein